MGTKNNNNSKMMLWRRLNVGSEIAVYWKEYKGYFACSVIKTKNKPSSLFQVEYEDGSIEWTDMSKVKFRWQEFDDEEFDSDRDDIDNDNKNNNDDNDDDDDDDANDNDDDDDDDDDKSNIDVYEEEDNKISDVDDDRSYDGTFKRKTTTSSTSSNKRMKKEEDNVDDDSDDCEKDDRDKEEHTDIKKLVVPKTTPMQVASKKKSTETEDDGKSSGDDSSVVVMTNKDDGAKDEVNDETTPMQVASKKKSTKTEDDGKSSGDDSSVVVITNKDDGTKDEVNDDGDDDCIEEANEEDDEKETYDDEDDINQKKQKQISAKAKKVDNINNKSNKDDDVQKLSEKISNSPVEEVNPDSDKALKEEENDDTDLTKEDEDGANNNVGDGLKEEIKKKHDVARKDAKKAPVKKKSTKAMKELSDDKTTSTIKRLSSKEVKKAHDNKELTKQNALLYIMVNHHMVGTTYLTFEQIFKDLGFKPKNKAIEQAWKEVRAKKLVEEANVSDGAKKHFQLTPEGIDLAASEDYKYQLANPPRTTEQLHEQIKKSANKYGVQIFDLLLKNGSMSTDELADECGVSKNGHNFFNGFRQHKTFGYVIKDPSSKRASWILSPDKAFIN